MSARVYVFPRGLAKVPRATPATSDPWGNDDAPPTASEAAAWWRREADSCRREAERLSGEVLRALARAQSCDRLAARCEQQVPSAQDAAGTASLGSSDPNLKENPREPA